MPPKPVAQPRLAPRLYQLATEALARDIRSGTLPAGRPLTQTGVADRFGISRAPARKALEDLADLGLLMRSASGRFHVAAGQQNSTVDAAQDDPGHAADPESGRLMPQTSGALLYPEVELAIVSRSSLAQWRVNESMIARHYGVSRTVAREVVVRLEQRGIIVKDDAGRWLAPALTQTNIDELYELRWVLEPLAMEKAAPLLPAGYLAGLRHELEAAMQPGAAICSALLDRLEHRLHVELLGYCGNRALMQAISLPQALLIAHHFLYSWTLELFGTEPFLGEHLDIIRKLEDGDLPAAKAALIAHLRISRRRAMLRIDAIKDLHPPEALPYLEALDPA